MAELKIERDHPGRTARFWRRDGIVVVQLGRDLSELEQRRVIRDAMREHGIIRRRRGILPVLIPPGLRDAARDHPTTTAAVTGVLAAGVAAGAVLGTTLPSDDPKPRRRRPPAVAGPSPTHGPTTVPQPRRPTAGASPSPGHGDGPAPHPTRTAAPVTVRPTPTRPPDSPGSSPPATAQPPTKPPTRPPTPQPGRRCVATVNLPPLLRVDLLCTP